MACKRRTSTFFIDKLYRKWCHNVAGILKCTQCSPNIRSPRKYFFVIAQKKSKNPRDVALKQQKCCVVCPQHFWGSRVSRKSVICSISCKLEISLRYRSGRHRTQSETTDANLESVFVAEPNISLVDPKMAKGAQAPWPPCTASLDLTARLFDHIYIFTTLVLAPSNMEKHQFCFAPYATKEYWTVFSSFSKVKLWVNLLKTHKSFW